MGAGIVLSLATYSLCQFNVFAEVESIFLPWLMREAEIALDEKILSRVLLDG